MSVLWYKLWHDLWHQKSRTFLVILSITAGLFSVGGIFGMVDQLITGMDEAHLEVAPSHINIILRNYVTEDVVETLREIEGVVDIDPVNQISIRYKINPDDSWSLGTVVQRDDFEDQTFDLMILNEGEWPSEDQLGIERLSSQYFSPGIGDSVIFQIGGEEETRTINGLVRHPFVQPPLFGGQAHFFTDAAGLSAFGIPEGVYGQLLVRVEPYSQENAQAVAAEIRSQLANQGFGVIVNLFQDPDQHWGRMFVEGINLVLQVMAVVALFMSMVLVFNTFTALITQQTDQIGIIKAIGGRRKKIVGLYLVNVFIFGLVSLLLAMPTSAVFSFFMSRWFLNLFNIDYDVFQVSQRALILQSISALVIPLLAILWPVIKGTAITVREALSTYGLGGDFKQKLLDQVIEKFSARFLPTMYAAALGNLFRRKGRLALTLLSLITAGVMFLVVMSLIASINFTLDNEMARQGYDVRIGFTGDQDIDEVLSLTQEIDDVEEAEMWFSRNATILRAGERLQDSAGLGAQLLGIPAGSRMYRPIIMSGRWLQADDGQVVVMSEETANKNQLFVGDLVSLDLGELGTSEWEIVGLYRVIYGTGFVIEPIYAPLSAMTEVTGQENRATQVLVKGNVADLEQETAFAEGLKTHYETAGLTIDFYTTTARLEERVYADNQFNSITSMLLSLAMLTGMVGGIGLAGSLGISVVERTREIGVLRSIGAQSHNIMTMFIMEGVLQGLISFLIATPLAFILAQPMARTLGQTMLEVDLDFAFNYPAVGVWLVTVLVISIVASISPSRRATRISVHEVLSYG